jgi:ethanolamine utilization protein EutQ (cupin superfamily)
MNKLSLDKLSEKLTIYDIAYVDDLVENDEITPYEAGFMRWYDATADEDIEEKHNQNGRESHDGT